MPQQKSNDPQAKGADLQPRETESLNGYYKKVVLKNNGQSDFKLEGLALKVFNDRYALKNQNGEQIETTPEAMWRRVAGAIAGAETTPEKQSEWTEKFYAALTDFKFVPAGRILTGAGAKSNVTFYNCFVIPSPEDSREGIMDSVKTMVEILARGGGVGLNLSSIRPRGARVKGVNGTASGSVSFGALYSFATGLVIQGGSRRGALMLMLNDDHPDIEEFITVKRTMGQINHANLSVAVSDAFMAAVKNDADWNLLWEGKVFKTVKARYLWDMITESAWASGEPGMVFTERAQKESNTWYFENIISVNPCGEQPLPAWGVCNLGALNLSAFAENGKINWAEMEETIKTAVRFMDNVIDTTPYHFEENHKAQLKARRIGLGTMGLADFLIKLKVRYGADEALDLTKNVYSFIRDTAYRASVELAREKGAFPAFAAEKFGQGHFVRRLPGDIQSEIRAYGLRNSVLLTQAPTGTTGILANVSSGIEPVFDFAFKRRDRLGEHIVYHPLYKEYMDAHPDEAKPAYFVNAKELTPLEHVKMQAIIQEYTDASISKTVNAPEEHTHENVKELYMKAYELGCKGVTYFRENSRSESVLESLDTKKKKTEKPAAPTTPQNHPYPSLVKEGKEKSISLEKGEGKEGRPAVYKVSHPLDRPEVMSGKTYKVNTPYGKLYVTVNNDEKNSPFEVFATIGKSGGFFAESSEAICRLASLALRSSIDPQEVIKQLKGIRGPMFSFGTNGNKILSLPDAIAQVMERHLNGDQARLDLKSQEPVPEAVKPAAREIVESMADRGLAPQCPECGGELAMSEGCQMCNSCGFSKCG